VYITVVYTSSLKQKSCISFHAKNIQNAQNKQTYRVNRYKNYTNYTTLLVLSRESHVDNILSLSPPHSQKWSLSPSQPTLLTATSPWHLSISTLHSHISNFCP